MENLTKQQRYRERQKEKGKKQLTIFLDERQFYKLQMISIRRELTYSDIIEELIRYKNDTIHKIQIKDKKQRIKYNEAKSKFLSADYKYQYEKKFNR